MLHEEAGMADSLHQLMLVIENSHQEEISYNLNALSES
jgi:hypothetical protein